MTAIVSVSPGPAEDILLAAPAPGADFGVTAGAVVVALLAGRPVRIAGDNEPGPRLAASGTLALAGHEARIDVWGGHAAAAPLHAPRAVHASAGPHSRRVLGGPDVFGDPAWLLPWFHRPDVPKRWELGLVLPSGIPWGGAVPDWVRVIPASPAAAPAALRERIDAMLACRRIASPCVGALVLAEAYGLPCLPLIGAALGTGLKRVSTEDAALGLPVADFYAGLRRAAVPAYLHPPEAMPSMDRLVAAIDQAWSPAWLREEDLLESFPLPCATILPPDTGSVFDHPVLACTAPPPSSRSLPLPRSTARHPAASLQEWVDTHGRVPLAWAATSERAPFPNLGDALSAVIVSAMAGMPLQRRNFDDHGERMAAVGTIGHTLRNGTAHLWGTALDPSRNAFDRGLNRFAVPPETMFTVHATRGRGTAASLRAAGVTCPEIYGDPVWFLPRLMAARPVAPRWELGVILHITELNGTTPDATVLAEYQRYTIPPALAGAVRLISTYTGQGTAALLAKVDEIRACRRIVSTSFHGLVIPETFGIPNAWFSTHPGGAMMAAIDDPAVKMDHRVRDWYSGTDRRKVPIFGAQRHLPTRWDQVIRWLDTAWEPLRTDAQGLFDAFPLRKKVSFDQAAWPLDPELFDTAEY